MESEFMDTYFTFRVEYTGMLWIQCSNTVFGEENIVAFLGFDFNPILLAGS